MYQRLLDDTHDWNACLPMLMLQVKLNAYQAVETLWTLSSVKFRHKIYFLMLTVRSIYSASNSKPKGEK
jgi:hypothetical protein